MFKIVPILCLTFYLFSIQADSLKLKSLCNERTTKDENYVVNSYYRLKMNKTLPSIDFYLINETDVDKSKSSRIKKLMKEIYSEHFINSTKLGIKINDKEREITSLREESASGYDHYGRLIRRSYSEYCTNISFLLGNLTKLNENYLTEHLLNVNELKRKFQVLSDLDENQTSTFKDEFIDIFYEMPLATLDGFRVHRKGPIFLDDSNYGTLYFSLYVPFYDKNQSANVKSNCTCTDYLPKFYTVETSPIAKNRTEISD